MSEKKRGLGRGLGALIPSAPGRDSSRTASDPSPVDVLIPARSTTAGGPATEARPASAGSLEVPAARDAPTPSGPDDGGGAYYAELAPGAIAPNPRQPREVFDEDAMAELVASVREVGLLQPIVVRPAGRDRYELVMGERRWRAAAAAGLDAIPAIVRSSGDEVMLRDALLENLHRAQLNPLEEAAAYDQLLVDFGCTHDELAGRIGRSRPQISNTIRLLRLPPSVQRRVAAGVLSAGHARAVLALTDSAAQERLAQRIVAEGLSVRTVEELVAVGGSEAGSSPGRRRAKPVAPKLDLLAERLAERFETRVKVELGRAKGRVVVEFGSLDDLERIVRVMAPDALPAAAAVLAEAADRGAAAATS